MTDEYRLGDEVTWDWGDGAASGEITAIHTDDAAITVDGVQISREGAPGCPTYTVKREDGRHTLVARHELHPHTAKKGK